MSPYIQLFLLWVFVILISVFPYLLTQLISNAVTKERPWLEHLALHAKRVSVLFGLGIFAKSGSALILTERISHGFDFVGNIFFAAIVTYVVYAGFRANKDQSSE